MGAPITVTVGPLAAADDNGVCLSQASLAAGNLTINGALASGGVATLDRPRRIIVTSAGDDSGVTFTAYGTDGAGQPIQSKAVAGANVGAVDLGVSFKTVTRIAVSDATAAAVIVGTNTVADSRPVFFDTFGFSTVAIQVNVTGTADYTVQQTLDNPNGDGWSVPLGLENVVWFDHDDPALVTASASAQSGYSAAPVCARVTLNSGSGSVSATFVQHASPVK